jgi:hypothetical protein
VSPPRSDIPAMLRLRGGPPFAGLGPRGKIDLYESKARTAARRGDWLGDGRPITQQATENPRLTEE